MKHLARNIAWTLAAIFLVGQISAQVSINQSSVSLGAVAPPAHPVTLGQIREFLKLSRIDEPYRASWIAAMESKRSMGMPYWPKSFWDDLKKEMETTDLAPVITDLYRRYISAEMMESINKDLHRMTYRELPSTSEGAAMCRLQRNMKADNDAVTLALTQATFERVYDRHKVEIKAARAKYLKEHPDWKDN